MYGEINIYVNFEREEGGRDWSSVARILCS